MRKQRGVRKIDTFEVEGVTLHVHCDMETGEFSIEVDDEVLKDKSLSGVRSKAITYVRNKMISNFKPVIYIDTDHWNSEPEDHLLLGYSRYFRAKTPDGKLMFKAWRIEESNGDTPDEDRTDGVPSDDLMHFPSWKEKQVILDYTPERWLALRSISKAMAEVNKRLTAVIKPGKCEEFLAKITQNGLHRLLSLEKA